MEGEVPRRDLVRGAIVVTAGRVVVLRDAYGLSPALGIGWEARSAALGQIAAVETCAATRLARLNRRGPRC